MIDGKTADVLNRCSGLRVSPSGRIVGPRALPLPKDYVFIPFCSDLPAEDDSHGSGAK